MGWNLTNIQLPVAPNVRTRKRQQAVVAEPGMIPFLEAGIITAAEHNNPEWMALLANWLCAVGCLRHRHITKSSPQRLSASTVHAWCSQGKQAHSRNGFTWSAPAEFTNGFPWAQRVIDAWVVIGVQRFRAGSAIAEVQWYLSSPRFGGAVQCSHDAVSLL